ncbi:retrovirus-related Pol polyprotein from transposon 17.6 [Trichonephila clavipes]|nr:retrovirus-related Pol polyprotein from transposon 17.6 [Trichonephila clavipes]
MKTDFKTVVSLRVNSEDEDCFEKFKVKSELNGVERQCLRDTGSTIDLCASSWIDENDYLGEYVLVKSPLDDVCHRLPLAKVKFKTKGGEFYTKAAVKVNSHPSEPHLLSNRTAELIQSRCSFSVLMIDAMVTRNTIFPTQGDGTEPTIEFPAFVGKNEGETAQLKNSDFSSDQNKCKDQHVLWERAKWGVSECCRTKERNLERVVGTKRGEEFRKLGVPLKFTLEINQLSHPLSDSLGRVQGILKLSLKAFCEEKGEKRVLSALFTLHTVLYENRGFSPSKWAMTRDFMTPQNLIYEWRIFGKKLTRDKGCEKAFVELKGKLVSKPILFAPDFSKDFILQTDASDIGAGVVLSQKISGEEHPIILFLSKKISKAERNYSTVERELAEIILGLKRLKHYLDGQRFIIETDQNPLKYLNKMGGSNPRLQRWALSLQPFNFEIRHKLGKLHGNADGLSSLFINSWEGISELGARRHKETHPQCVLFAPDPVTTARLETHIVYPDIGAHGTRAGMRRNRWDWLSDNRSKSRVR